MGCSFGHSQSANAWICFNQVLGIWDGSKAVDMVEELMVKLSIVVWV